VESRLFACTVKASWNTKLFFSEKLLVFLKEVEKLPDGVRGSGSVELSRRPCTIELLDRAFYEILLIGKQEDAEAVWPEQSGFGFTILAQAEGLQ